MPVRVLIDNGEVTEHTVWVEDQETVFDLPCTFRPKMVIFNSGMRIPSKLKMDSWPTISFIISMVPSNLAKSDIIPLIQSQIMSLI